MLNIPSIQNVIKPNKIEQGFKLPLFTIVIGRNAEGNFFSENTLLSYISHQGASFYLKTPVSFGTKLKLTIDLPLKLGDKNLKLFIQGKVVFVEAVNNDNSQWRVSIKFRNNYRIK